MALIQFVSAALLQATLLAAISIHPRERTSGGTYAPLRQARLHSAGHAETSGASADTSAALAAQLHWATSKGMRPLHIMGLFETGTNLLKELLEANFPEKFWVYPRVQPQSTPEKMHSLDFWKHSNPEWIGEKNREAIRKYKALGVAMVREPLSWLQAVREQPYNLRRCINGTDWLTRPCLWKGHWGKTYGGSENIESNWNSWTRSYDNLTSVGFESAMLVRYEDLVFDTEGVLARIAALAHLPPPKHFKQIRIPAKETPQHVENEFFDATQERNRAYAMEKIQTKSYLKKFTLQGLGDACERLDQDLMFALGYNDCQDLLSFSSSNAGGSDAASGSHSDPLDG